ncbi:MAG: ParB/Srx family N-terminal domain-containing protein [Alphaproteobacteria bacterium]|nr:ParB/Srx family N-terminal domain-containing protein [Alphaproteobacteria bacterium]
MLIPLEQILVTHNEIRNKDSVENLLLHTNNGIVLSESIVCKDDMCAKIILVPIEKDKYLLHDGHHRVRAIHLSGRTHLDPLEYRFENIPISIYNEINFEAKWVTPFDIYTEVRKKDFLAFKKRVFDIYTYSEKEARAFIYAHADEYKEPRRANTIADVR